MGDQVTSDLLNYQRTVQNNLIQLTALERTLNEQIMLQGGSSTMGAYLKKVFTQKESLWQSLQTIYDVKRGLTQDSAINYKNVLAAKTAVQQELANSQALIKAYEDKIGGKRRMNQIAEYQYKKYMSYKEILKSIVYFSILIIILTLLVAQPWFPKLIGKGLIILAVAYFVYVMFSHLYWHFRREDKYWDKFRQDTPKEYDGETGVISLSKWEHNKENIKKIFDNLGGSNQICQNAAAAISSATAAATAQGLGAEEAAAIGLDAGNDELASMVTPGTMNTSANPGDLN